MDLFGAETPVVVDVMSEKGEKDDERNRGGSMNIYRWHRWSTSPRRPHDLE